jgi:hypothetical protein
MKLKPILTEEGTRDALKIRNKIREGEDLLEILLLEQLSDVTIRFVEISGIVRVMVEIGDKTTHQNIRDIIPFVLKLRDRIQDEQSFKIASKLFHRMQQPNNREELLELLSYMQEHGVSYAKLAERFNVIIAKLLEKYLIIHQKVEISTEELVNETEIINFANNLLNALSVIDIDLDDALEQMKAGMPPFEKGYPVSRYKLIEALRTLRKGKQHIMVKNALEKVKAIEKKQARQEV